MRRRSPASAMAPSCCPLQQGGVSDNPPITLLWSSPRELASFRRENGARTASGGQKAVIKSGVGELMDTPVGIWLLVVTAVGHGASHHLCGRVSTTRQLLQNIASHHPHVGPPQAILLRMQRERCQTPQLKVRPVPLSHSATDLGACGAQPILLPPLSLPGQSAPC